MKNKASSLLNSTLPRQSWTSVDADGYATPLAKSLTIAPLHRNFEGYNEGYGLGVEGVGIA